MKNFSEFLTEQQASQRLASNVVQSTKEQGHPKTQIGYIITKDGIQYAVHRPDAHDLSYFGKNIVRIGSNASGKQVAAYVDWNKGTISFYSSDADDDKDFLKPVKFRKGYLYESLENLDLMEQLSEEMEIYVPLDESFVKGKIYKGANDMLLKYTGRVKEKETGKYNVFTVVDSTGTPRLISGKRFEQEYTSDMLKTLKPV